MASLHMLFCRLMLLVSVVAVVNDPLHGVAGAAPKVGYELDNEFESKTSPVEREMGEGVRESIGAPVRER